MTPPFSVRTVPQFDRLLRRLKKRHLELVAIYAEALDILQADPYNVGRRHDILKLKRVGPDEGGQFRLALRRFRFRYDIYGQEVVLYYCGLRREGTYR